MYERCTYVPDDRDVGCGSRAGGGAPRGDGPRRPVSDKGATVNPDPTPFISAIVADRRLKPDTKDPGPAKERVKKYNVCRRASGARRENPREFSGDLYVLCGYTSHCFTGSKAGHHVLRSAKAGPTFHDHFLGEGVM